LNFLVCQLVALLLGFPFRSVLAPEKTSTHVRHLVQIAIGIPMCYFCFGSQMLHYLISSLVCYGLMVSMKPGIMEKAVFVVSMGYLAVMHIYRQVYDYGGYTLDITGPLMVGVQKLSSLGFCIKDGSVKDETKLTPVMKLRAVKEVPTLTEFLSYMFCFHNLMCGPFSFYNDYIAFMDGTCFVKAKELRLQLLHVEPFIPSCSLISPLCTCEVRQLPAALLLPFSSLLLQTEAEFLALGFVRKMLFIMACTTLHRFKYYFAWKLGELVNLAAGLGFNGYDESGKAKWDLINNADIFTIETCTSLKILLDKWNMTTTFWLRYVVYERMHSTLGVFALSAFWHGYYPGYYITFIGGAFFIHTARLVRRKIRPLFQTSGSMALLYDCLTGLATRLSIGYLVFPHVLLEYWQAVIVYRYVLL
ncbi:hypothetical protein CAPTEDRAFT_24585, partial [Capitella teleta]